MMCFEQPNVKPNGYYPIGVAAARLGIHRNTLRKYSDNGEIKGTIARSYPFRLLFTGRELLKLWSNKTGGRIERD